MVSPILIGRYLGVILILCAFQLSTFAVTSAISAGGYHSLFLKSDGTVWAAGYNLDGELGDGTMTARNTQVQVMSGVIAISTGMYHSLFLKSDGSVWATGWNGYGQLGDGTKMARSTPVQVMSGVVAVSAGFNHSLFLKSDGSVWATGSNGAGQLGDGTTMARSTPVQVMSGVAAISAGGSHSLFLKSDGSVWASGWNGDGQLGDGTTTARRTPVQVMSGVVAVSAGLNHSLFLKSDGSVWASGYNLDGELGDGTTTARSTPVQVMSGVAAISAGGSHSLFLKSDGSVWASGWNGDGQLGDGTTTARRTPVQVMSGVTAISAGSCHSLFLKNDGSDWATGWNGYGQLGDGTTTARSMPTISFFRINGGTAQTITFPVLATRPFINGLSVPLNAISTSSLPISYAVVSGPATVSGSILIVTGAGTITICASQIGNEVYLPADDVTTVLTVTLNAATPLVAISAGKEHSLFMESDGSVWETGLNYYGQLGDGTTTDHSMPIQVMRGVVAISAGAVHSLFLKSDGSVWASGFNGEGELGNGTTTDRSTPVQVMSGVAAISTGGGHSLFLKSDGSVWASGLNADGQLGDGTTTNRSTPVQVMSGVIAISAGWGHSLFLKSDGSVWASGANYYGQFGDGTTTSRYTPVQVMSGVIAISAGWGHSLFLKSDGSVWATGSNGAGQLGDGTTASRSTPVQVMSGVIAISAGMYHSLFLKSDGSVWASGYNLDGQLGDGTTASRSTPVQVMSGGAAISAGGGHSLFLKSDGSVWASGSNGVGQLGDGTTTSHSTPVIIFPAIYGGTPQTITFGALSDQTYGNAPFTVSATASSGLTPTFSIVSGPAIINGNTVTLTGAGMVVMRASRAGNADYLAAPTVDQSFTIAQAAQTITFGTLSGKTYGNAPFTVSATASSGLTPTFTIVSGPATISGNTVTLTGVGIVVVRAAQVGNVNYAAASTVDQSFEVIQGTQTINFGTLSGKTCGNAPFIVSATASSGLAPTFTIVSGPATISDNTVTLTGVGTVIVRAEQAGDVNYAAATSVDRSFIVTKGVQTITFGPLSGKSYGGAPFTVSATASSGLSPTYSIISGPAVVSGSTVTLTGVGTVIVRATQAGDANYAAAPTVDRSFTVTKGVQTITFDALSGKSYGNASFTLSATASSGLSPTYSIVSGPATISGSTVTIKGVGTVVVRAAQAGNVNYSAATSVDQSFTVSKAIATVTLGGLSQSYTGTARHATATTTPSGLAVTFTYNGGATAPVNAGSYEVIGVINSPLYQGSASGTLVIGKSSQTITFAAPPAKTYSATPFAVSATASSKLAPTFSIISGPATISGNMITLTGGGTVVVRASQDGSANYAAATPVDRSLTVTKITQTITFAHPATVLMKASPLTLTATASSKLPVTLSVVSGPAALGIDGKTLTFTGAGSVVINATQAGNAIYLSAPAVSATIKVSKVAQTITFTPPATVALNVSPLTLTATASSGLPVAFVVTGPATLNGQTLTLTGIGTVTVKASQAGNTVYNAAVTLTKTIKVTAAVVAKSLISKSIAAPAGISLDGNHTALLVGVDTSSSPGLPIGGLDLQVDTAKKTYTALLTLVNEAEPLFISGTVKVGGTDANPLITAYWPEPGETSAYTVEFSLSADGLIVTVRQAGQIIAETEVGVMAK